MATGVQKKNNVRVSVPAPYGARHGSLASHASGTWTTPAAWTENDAGRVPASVRSAADRHHQPSSGHGFPGTPETTGGQD